MPKKPDSRFRATYDLTPEIIDSIKEIANDAQTTASQVAALGLGLFLDRIENDPDYLRGFLVLLPDNPRYAYKVVLKKVKGKK